MEPGMEEEEFQRAFNLLYPRWFVKLYSAVGLFPDLIKASGVLFRLRGVIVLFGLQFFAVLSARSMIFPCKDNQGCKAHTAAKLVYLQEFVTVATILSYAAASRKGKGKQLHRILTRVVAVENFSAKSIGNETHPFDILIIAINAFSCFLVPLVIYRYGVYNSENLLLIFRVLFRWLQVSIVLIYTKLVAHMARGFIGINKLIKHSRSGPRGDIYFRNGRYIIFTN